MSFKNKLKRIKYKERFGTTYPKISFCTTCMNRSKYLLPTLSHNLKMYGKESNIEFILLDYNSSDGLEDMAKEQFSSHIDSGNLVYYKMTDPTIFERCHAKNIAHSLSTGEIVANVDSDLFLLSGLKEFILDYMVQYQFLISGIADGTFGFIVLDRKDFDTIGGYDETYLGYGCEDTDLGMRLTNLGRIGGIITPGLVCHLEHGASIRNYDKEIMEKQYYKTQEHNFNKVVEVNPDGYAVATVYKNFSKEPIEIGYKKEVNQ